MRRTSKRRSVVSGDEDPKRREYLEKNKEAARKCREKKMSQIEKLKQRTDPLLNKPQLGPDKPESTVPSGYFRRELLSITNQQLDSGLSGKKVRLFIKDFKENRLTVVCLRAAPLVKIMKVAKDSVIGQGHPDLRFLYNGTLVKADDTAEDLGLVDGDVINVFPVQSVGPLPQSWAAAANRRKKRFSKFDKKRVNAIINLVKGVEIQKFEKLPLSDTGSSMQPPQGIYESRYVTTSARCTTERTVWAST